MIYLIIGMVVILFLILKLFIHIEKKHKETIEILSNNNENIDERLSALLKENELINHQIRFIVNFIEEDESLGNIENRNRLKYRLSEVFFKRFNKTKLKFDIENIESFHETHRDLGNDYKEDSLKKAKIEEQKYSAFPSTEG